MKGRSTPRRSPSHHSGPLVLRAAGGSYLLLMLSLLGQVGFAEPPRGTIALPEDQRGEQLFREGRYEASLRFFEEQIAAHPADPELRYRRGVVLAVQGKLKEALAAWEEVVALDPSHPRAQEALWRVRLKLAFERGADRARPATGERLSEARRWITAGRYSRARALLGNDVPPESAEEQQLLLAASLLGAGEIEEAETLFRSRIRPGPWAAAASVGLGDALRLQGDGQRAEWSYRLALELAASGSPLPGQEQERVRVLAAGTGTAESEPGAPSAASGEEGGAGEVRRAQDFSGVGSETPQ